MRRFFCCVTGLFVVLLFCAPARTASPVNEPAAFLVFPAVLTETAPGSGVSVETIVSISNTSDTDLKIHLSFINGEDGPGACSECDPAPLALPGNGTVTVAVRGEAGQAVLEVFNETDSITCPFTRGFMTVNLEDDAGNTLYDNVLMGKQVVVGYESGQSFAMSAVPFLGSGYGGTDGDRVFDFDNAEYYAMPRIVAADFLAPNQEGVSEPGAFDAYMALFTLGFQNGSPPLVDCSVTGWDAHSGRFSSSLQFGCWAQIELSDISWDYAYPNLGSFDGTPDENGWAQINCRVDTNPADHDGFEAFGGVHGAFFQYAPAETVLKREAGGPPMSNAGAWGRLLYQSVTTGDHVTLDLDTP